MANCWVTIFFDAVTCKTLVRSKQRSFLTPLLAEQSYGVNTRAEQWKHKDSTFQILAGPHYFTERTKLERANYYYYFILDAYTLDRVSINYACAVMYDTPLMHARLMPNQPPNHTHRFQHSTGSAIPTCSLYKQGTYECSTILLQFPMYLLLQPPTLAITLLAALQSTPGSS